VRRTVSLSSAAASSMICTQNVWLVMPGAKVRVPLPGWKSLPALADPFAMV
jgi:hypothetical protein